MKVLITERRLSDGGWTLSEGDSVTVPDELGAYWCKNGWAKDVSGAVPTGERKVDGQELEVDSVVHELSLTPAGA